MSEEIAVLGPEGTFTSQAARQMQPQGKLRYMDSVKDVFQWVKENDGSGVVALENSLEGSVGETIEHLLKDDVYIRDEHVMEVRFGLVSDKETGLEDIKEVLSHPHALAQCRIYIKENLPQARQVPVKSTAHALKQIKGDSSKAAIALASTARKNGLEIIEEDIQDSYSETRFIMISTGAGEGDKTSIIFALKDRPGALYEILKVFADREINLTKIESRPARTQIGDYVFFVDFENKKQDLEEIFSEVKKQTTFLKYLGSY